MTQRTIAYRSENGGYRLSFPYDPTLVSIIKTIPPAARSWDPTSKTWWIDKNRLEGLRRAVDQGMPGTIWVNIGDPDDEPKPKPPPKRPAARDLESAFADVFRLLPTPLVKPVKKALLHAVHPDHGGDHETTIALNAAWQVSGAGR